MAPFVVINEYVTLACHFVTTRLLSTPPVGVLEVVVVPVKKVSKMVGNLASYVFIQ